MNEKIRRIRLKKTGRLLAGGLVISALLGGLYEDRLHFVFGLSACGSLLLAAGWFLYLKLTGDFRWLKKRERKKVPYYLRREKEERPARAAFLRDSADFDDDLNAATSTDEEDLSEEERQRNRIFACTAAGAALLLLSCVIGTG